MYIDPMIVLSKCRCRNKYGICLSSDFKPKSLKTIWNFIFLSL